LAISIKPDASVIIRVPYRTSAKTIQKLVNEKASWIIKHRDRYRNEALTRTVNKYYAGEKHLYRGMYHTLKIERSAKSYCYFYNKEIEIGLSGEPGPGPVKTLLYKAYKEHAEALFPELVKNLLIKYSNQNFKVASLKIRTMKSRLGSCSSRGAITLNTELIKAPDQYIEYVITHELCHLKHHNHGPHFYELLSELLPDWKKTKKELRVFLH
jgi:predicted metal-dependent hydrolase